MAEDSLYSHRKDYLRLTRGYRVKRNKRYYQLTHAEECWRPQETSNRVLDNTSLICLVSAETSEALGVKIMPIVRPTVDLLINSPKTQQEIEFGV